MKRHTLFWIICIVVVVTSTAAVIEISCRLIAGTSSQLGYLLRYWETQALTAFEDPVTGGLMEKPRLNFTSLNREGQFIRVKTDRLGFRNERDYDQAPILALGDSFTYGDGVSESQRWASVLAQKAGVEIYVVAAGLTGPAQQLSILQRTVKTLHQSTRTVLWMVFSGNDISDSYDYFLRKNNRKTNAAASGQHATSSGFVIWALQHSYAARFGLVMVRILNLRLARSSAAIRVNVDGSAMDFYPVPESYKTSEEFRIGLTEASTAISDFAAELKSQGRRLVVIYAPSKEETYADKLKAVGVPPLGILRFNDQIGELCQRNGVEFLDLSSTFETEGQLGIPLYFHHDGHWTPRGNQVAADNIYHYLSSHPEPSYLPDSGK
jgi:lysophospholipase L1-like esterase